MESSIEIPQKKIKIELSCDSAIPLLNKYPKNTETLIRNYINKIKYLEKN